MIRLGAVAVSLAVLASTPIAATAREKAQIAASAEIGRHVRLFELPKGSRPHDVAPAPDGKIWYTAQKQGALGILDPVTGQVVQVSLGPDSAPHGVIQGPDGMAWITDGGQNAIVRYNPAGGKLDIWKLPADTGYTNLNTGAFDGQGTHWFTGQNGIYGRVSARDGKVQVWKDPKAAALWHRHRPRWQCLVCLARGQPSRAYRQRHRGDQRDRAAHERRRASPRLG